MALFVVAAVETCFMQMVTMKKIRKSRILVGRLSWLFVFSAVVLFILSVLFTQPYLAEGVAVQGVFASRQWEIDVGVLAPQETRTVAFQLQNTSSRPVHISRVVASCRCLSSELSSVTVGPLERIRIPVTVNTAGTNQDRVAQYVSLITSEEGEEESPENIVRLFVKGQIDRSDLFVAIPNALEFVTASSEDSHRQDMVIRGDKGLLDSLPESVILNLSGVEPIRVQCKYSALARHLAERVITFELNSSSIPAELNAMTAEVRLELEGPRNFSLVIPVAVRKADPIEVEPPRLFVTISGEMQGLEIPFIVCLPNSKYAVLRDIRSNIAMSWRIDDQPVEADGRYRQCVVITMLEPVPHTLFTELELVFDKGDSMEIVSVPFVQVGASEVDGSS